MVDVGMGQQNPGERFRIETQVAVLAYRFVAPALKEAAVEEEFSSWHFEQVAAAGDGAGSSMKREVHRGATPLWRLMRSQASWAVSA